MPASTTAAAAQAFVEKWERVTLNERATSQSHFNDLCRLLGQQSPTDADPHGVFYRFEKPLTKVGGRAGFADVWRKDYFAWEYKSKGKYPDLQAAYHQLLLYKEDLENPPILAACDIAHYEIHIAFTGHKTRIEKFDNSALRTVSARDFLHLVLTDPAQLCPAERVETITEKAAAKLATVAQFMERRGVPTEHVASFFTKLIFAFFAEDIGLLPNHLMSASLKETISRPQEFPNVVRALFQKMNEGGYFGPLSRVPRFNGGLFANDTVIPLTTDEIHLLYEAAKLDWQDVEPAIFGTLFERSIDPSKRTQLGLHYTSKDDILLIVDPVLMHPLEREWAVVQAQVETLRPDWEIANGAARQRFQHRMEGLLIDFMTRLTEVRVLDAAAGFGNFLYVALHQLKYLEKEIWAYAGGLGLAQPQLGVSPTQFYGIEKNPYAAALAQVVVWIGYWQWKRKNGFFDVQEPILEALDNIQCRDAILEYDDMGQPVEPAWPMVEVIIGNPPFLGDKRMRGELGDVYVDNLRKLYEHRVPGGADLVTHWFEKARKSIQEGNAKRAGLLATQGIRGAVNRVVLSQIKKTGDIFMAWSDRHWVLDGAAVRVSLIGFDDGSEQERFLDGRSSAHISAGLKSLDVHSSARLRENDGICFLGMMKAGPFNLDEQTARTMLEATVNTSGRSNSDVVRRRLGGQDVTSRTRNTWIIDFGVDTTETEASQYELPFKYILTHVKPLRDENRRPTMKNRWWIHGEPRRGLRSAIKNLHRCVVTPEVSKYRIFIWMDIDILPDHKLHVFARDDDYFFGILHSRLHTVWALATSIPQGDGKEGGRPTYKSTETFETFPFPWAPGSECQDDPRVQAIAAAARDLVAARDAWLTGAAYPELPIEKRTLTNLYNARPDWLDGVHRQLDAAVLDAYGWSHSISDDKILAQLLALNLDRASGQGSTVVQADDVLVESD